MRSLVVNRFSPHAKALRAHFDQRFADPRKATGDRFVWDLWHVPDQYTALRTPAWEFFPQRVYDAFHQQLVWWGRRTLGCHDVSPPWLSCYVNGCEQRLHGDLPHGPVAFVFSLTPDRPTFRGGETLLLRDEMLDFWRSPHAGGLEEAEVFEAIAPRFNRLVTFDPRLPHGVRRVEGSMDPAQGRLVIHGWFVSPRPFIEGPLSEAALGDGIEQLTSALQPWLQGGEPVSGLLSLGFQVSAQGVVKGLTVLANTLRAPPEAQAVAVGLVKVARKALTSFRFPKQKGVSRVTLPLLFER